MTKFLFFAGGAAHPGHEAEYDRWYREEHLPAVLKVDGFQAATRYRAAPTSFSQCPFDFVTLYEVEAETAESAHAALTAAARAGELGSSDASDRSRAAAWFVEEIGPRTSA